MVKENKSAFNYKVELYEARGTRSDRPLWAIFELGLEDHLTLKSLSLNPEESNPEHVSELRRLNPMVQFPTMVLTAPDSGQQVCTESTAMVHLLAEMCDRLQPAAGNVFARAQYYRVMTFAACDLDSAVTTVFLNQVHSTKLNCGH